MFGPLGIPEIIIIFVVALLIFGPKKLPQLGKSLGRTLNEFRRASNEIKRTIEDEISNDDPPKPSAKRRDDPDGSAATDSDVSASGGDDDCQT